MSEELPRNSVRLNVQRSHNFRALETDKMGYRDRVTPASVNLRVSILLRKLSPIRHGFRQDEQKISLVDAIMSSFDYVSAIDETDVLIKKISGEPGASPTAQSGA